MRGYLGRTSGRTISLVALLEDLQVRPPQERRRVPSPLSGRIVVDLRGDRASRFDGRAGAELFDSNGSLRASIKLSQGKADLEIGGRHRRSSIRIGGWARLFDSVPSYDLTARLRAHPSRGSLLPPSKWLGNSQRSIAVRMLGRGLPPHRAFGWARARIDRPSGEPGLLGSGRDRRPAKRPSGRIRRADRSRERRRGPGGYRELEAPLQARSPADRWNRSIWQPSSATPDGKP